MRSHCSSPRSQTIWSKGYDYIVRVGKLCKYDYNVTECRIAAMAYEAGWKAAKRQRNKR